MTRQSSYYNRLNEAKKNESEINENTGIHRREWEIIKQNQMQRSEVKNIIL